MHAHSIRDCRWVPSGVDPDELACRLGSVLDDAVVPAPSLSWEERPTLPFLLAWSSLLGAVADASAGSPPVAMIHRHQSIRLFQAPPESPRAPVFARTTVGAVRNTRLGALVELRSWCRVGVRPLAALRADILLRGATLPATTRLGTRRVAGSLGDEEGPSITLHPRPGATSRYADVAGDHNPIHLDQTAAVAAGFPEPVMHGMLTLALAVRAAASLSVHADRRVRCIAGDFAAPARTTVPLKVVLRQPPITAPRFAASLRFTVEQEGRVVLRAGRLDFCDSARAHGS